MSASQHLYSPRRTNGRPARVSSKGKGVYKDSTGVVKRPRRRDAHRDLFDSPRRRPLRAATSNRVQAPPPVDNRHDRSSRANDPVDAKLLTHHSERTRPAGNAGEPGRGSLAPRICAHQTRTNSHWECLPMSRATSRRFASPFLPSRFPALYGMPQSPQSPTRAGSGATSFHDRCPFSTVV